MVLIVGGTLCLLILIAAAVFLWRSYREYRGARGELDSSFQRLESLYRREPYPSDANIRIVEKNRDLMCETLDQSLAGLRAKEITPKTMEAAEFPRLLGQVLTGLRDRASAARVTLPEKFAFGFDSYALGKLPVAANVPRLTVELQTIDRLCDLLYQSRVIEILSIRRAAFDEEGGGLGDEFDPYMGGGSPFGPMGGPPMGGGAPSAPQPVGARSEAPCDPDKLFSWEPYELTFRCADAALWSVLSGLATNPLFVVVTSLSLDTDAMKFKGEERVPRGMPGMPGMPGMGPISADFGPPGLPGFPAGPGVPPPGGEPAEGTPRTYLTREERTIAGRELVTVKLKLNVYRFSVDPEPKAEEGQP